MIAFSSISTFQVRLPSGNNQTLIIYIRDIEDCITEYNIPSIAVIPDLTEINDFINGSKDSITRLLSGQNQNIVSQILTLFSQQLNTMSNDDLNEAVSSKLNFIINN